MVMRGCVWSLLFFFWVKLIAFGLLQFRLCHCKGLQELIIPLMQEQVRSGQNRCGGPMLHEEPNPKVSYETLSMQCLLTLALLCLMQSSMEVDLHLFLLVRVQLGFDGLLQDHIV